MSNKFGRQQTKAPLAAALSPFMILLYPPNPWCDVCRLTTTPGSTSPTLFEQWSGFFYVPQELDKCNCCETGTMDFRPYPRSLVSLTVGRCHYKGSTFLLVKDPECWSGRGSNPWPPAQQTGALPTEPTRRQLDNPCRAPWISQVQSIDLFHNDGPFIYSFLCT